MALPAGRLFERCEDSLAAIVSYYSATPGAVKLPDRRFVSAGVPVYDCPLVAVWAELVEPHAGDPAFAQFTAKGALPGHGLLVGQFVATVVRCSEAMLDENAEPPTVEEEEEIASAVHHDALHLHAALLAAARAGMAGCDGLVIMSWQLAGGQLQAGYGGGELRYRLALNG